MDRIVIVNEDEERTLDIRSRLYVLVALCPEDEEVWTRAHVEAAGDFRGAILDPMHLVALLQLAGEDVYDAVRNAMENSGLADDLKPDLLLAAVRAKVREKEKKEAAADAE